MNSNVFYKYVMNTILQNRKMIKTKTGIKYQLHFYGIDIMFNTLYMVDLNIGHLVISIDACNSYTGCLNYTLFVHYMYREFSFYLGYFVSVFVISSENY